MKKLQIGTIVFLVIALLTIQLAACAAKPSDSSIQTAVAGTLAAASLRPGQEVTKLVEVTRVVEVTAPVSIEVSTPTATSSPSTADTATETLAATTAQTETQPAAAQGTAAPTAVQPGAALYWSLQYFVARYTYMTDLQKIEFAGSLPGRTVSWYALLSNVTNDGAVIMKFPYSLQGSIILYGVPLATADRINRGDQVEFTGMIESFDIVFNILVLSNVKIIAFYPEPTATITPTPTPVTPTPGVLK